MSGLSTSRWLTIAATQVIITIFWLLLSGSLAAVVQVLDDMRGEVDAAKLSVLSVVGVGAEVVWRWRFDMVCAFELGAAITRST